MLLYANQSSWRLRMLISLSTLHLSHFFLLWGICLYLWFAAGYAEVYLSLFVFCLGLVLFLRLPGAHGSQKRMLGPLGLEL